MSSYPEVSERVSSLLSTQVKTQLNDIKKRKASAMSTRSASSTVSEFLDAKLHEFVLDHEYINHYRKALKHAYEVKIISEKDWNRMRNEIKKNETKEKKEYVTLKRQRKLIEDNLEEFSVQNTFEQPYANAMLNRVKLPRQLNSKERSLKRHTQENFKHELAKYYEAETTIESTKFCYCAATQRWWKSELVKAVHIVPKSLESEELSYLFGAGEMGLSEPRNEALDRAQIAIVPVPSGPQELTRWKILLVNDEIKNDIAIATTPDDLIRWRDINNQELKFLNKKRPARRFLYFRYILTYMKAKELGSNEWIKKNDDAREYMWVCTPGPYVRKSMLRALAGEVSDHYLPEAFYEKLFTQAVGNPTRSADEEKVLAISLGLKIKDEEDSRMSDRGDDEEDEYEGDEDKNDSDDEDGDEVE